MGWKGGAEGMSVFGAMNAQRWREKSLTTK